MSSDSYIGQHAREFDDLRRGIVKMKVKIFDYCIRQ
jgi:hypothetical protein